MDAERLPGMSHAKRKRRRGPRSFDAVLLRSRLASHTHTSPQGDGRRYSRPTSPFELAGFTILHVNVRGFISHQHELQASIRLMQPRPNIICMNETFLNQSVQQINLEGYVLVSRKDRPRAIHAGGIAVFAKRDVASQIVHLGNSDDAERSWHLLHTDSGPLLLGCWYRPPHCGEVTSIETLHAEIEKYSASTFGTILLGDMNAHNKKWLRFSSHNSAEGTALCNSARTLGLVEMVKSPTRGPHLLDLCLTDMVSNVQCSVIPGVADHNMVLTEVDFGIQVGTERAREVWDFNQANWIGLNTRLATIDWSCLETMHPDDGAEHFTNTVIREAKCFIPVRTKVERTNTHPWINERCLALVAAKHAAMGTPQLATATAECSDGLLAEYQMFVARTRERLRCLARGSKKWWRLSSKLMSKPTKMCSVPSLRRSDGN